MDHFGQLPLWHGALLHNHVSVQFAIPFQLYFSSLLKLRVTVWPMANKITFPKRQTRAKWSPKVDFPVFIFICMAMKVVHWMLGFDGGLVLDVWALLRIVLNKYKENHSAYQHHTWPMSYYSEVIIQSSENISLQWWQLFTCSSYMHNALRAKEDISNKRISTSSNNNLFGRYCSYTNILRRS